MSSSTNPPDRYGSDDERDRSSGATPPPYGGGSTPPPYGSTPPGYGSTPSDHGSAGQAYGSTPPAYGGSDPGQSPYGYGFPKNNLGVWSLVLGLLGMFVCGLFAGIPAIVVGHKARGAVAEGQANNPGLATAGIVLGWISTILSVIGIIAVVFLVSTGAMMEYSTAP